MNMARMTLVNGLLVVMNISALAVADEADDDVLEPGVSRETLARMASSAADDSESGTAIETATTPPAVQSENVVDEILLDRTAITGNQELPKMLYIVPWQKSEVGDLVGKPESTALQDVLAPIDRSVFRRQIDNYHERFRDIEEE